MGLEIKSTSALKKRELKSVLDWLVIPENGFKDHHCDYSISRLESAVTLFYQNKPELSSKCFQTFRLSMKYFMSLHVLISRILYLSHRHFPYEIFNQTNEFNPEEQTHFGLKLSFLISLCVCNLHKPAAQRYYFWTHFVMEDFTWVLFSIIIIILVINNNDLYSSLRWHCYFKTRDIKLDLELKSANVTARGESRERN